MKQIFRLPKPVLAVALSCVLIAGGCTASQISSYINLAAQIAINVLQITSAVSASPISAHDTAMVSSFQQVLQSSVANFEASKSAGNSALVSVAVAAETNVPQFLAAAQFDNPILAGRVTAAADSFLTIVESIAATVQPIVVVPPAPGPVALKSGGVYKVPMRAKVPVHDIVNQWNQIVCQNAAPSCLVK